MRGSVNYKCFCAPCSESRLVTKDGLITSSLPSFFAFGFSAMLSSLFPVYFFMPLIDYCDAETEGAASLEPGLLPPRLLACGFYYNWLLEWPMRLRPVVGPFSPSSPKTLSWLGSLLDGFFFIMAVSCEAAFKRLGLDCFT